MVTWFAGLFYLPRLFVYHSMNESADSAATLAVMERKLMIMTHIGGTLTWIFGLLLLWQTPALLDYNWMHLKLVLVAALTAYHFVCARLVTKFAGGENHHSHRWYRWFNELPTVILISVVALVVLKPF